MKRYGRKNKSENVEETGEETSQQHDSSKRVLQGEGEKKENTEGGIHKAD